MPADTLFTISNPIALIGWLFLIFLPRWKWTTRLVTPVVIPVLLGVLYVILIVGNFGNTGGGFGTLEEVKLLFANDYVLVAGWIHYLVFDLFVGSWILRDAQRERIHHLIVVPCLLGTFMFGPFGLILYFLVRGIRRSKLALDGAATPHDKSTVPA